MHVIISFQYWNDSTLTWFAYQGKSVLLACFCLVLIKKPNKKALKKMTTHSFTRT